MRTHQKINDNFMQEMFENYQMVRGDEDTQIEKVSTVSLTESSDPRTFRPTPEPSRVRVNRNLPSRKCTVYYTKETGLCDKGAFEYPESWYQEQLKNPNLDKATADIYRRMLRSYQRMPAGMCKTVIPGWVEPVYDPNVPIGGPRAPLPKKNKYVKSAGSTSDWAYCYAPVANDAEAISKPYFADGKAIINVSALEGKASDGPFNDGRKYSKIQFNTANLNLVKKVKLDTYNRADNLKDVICSIGTEVNSSVPTSYIALTMKGTTTRFASAAPLRYVTSGDATQITRLVPYPAAQSDLIMSNLFETKVVGRKIYLTSKPLNSTVVKLKNDTCGRITDVLNRQQVALKFNVPQTNQFVLYTSTDEVTKGTYSELKKRLAAMEVESKQKDDAFMASMNKQTTPKYEPGLLKTRYILSFGSAVRGNSKSDLDGLFAQLNPSHQASALVDDNGNPIRPKFFCTPGQPRMNVRALTANPNASVPEFEDDCRDEYNPRPGEWFAFQYNGYIEPKETGDYSFWLNSDDAADMMVDGKIVATHYGSHGLDGRAVNGSYAESPDNYIQNVLVQFNQAINKQQFVQSHQSNFAEALFPILANDGLSPEDKIAQLSKIVVVNKIRLETGKKYSASIRVVQTTGQSGLAVYWLPPSKRGMSAANCSGQPEFRPQNIPIPDKFKCYEEIPASAYSFNMQNSSYDPVRRKAMRELNKSKTDLNKLRSALATIREGMKAKVQYFFQYMNGRDLFDVIVRNGASSALADPTMMTVMSTVSSTGSVTQANMLFISAEEITSDVDAALNLNAAPVETGEGYIPPPVIIQQDELDISNNYRRVDDSPLINYTRVQYTLSMFIYIENICPTWRPIFLHGVNDGDRTPGVYVYPNSSFIHFRQRSANWDNNGCDLRLKVPRLGRWFHFAAVVDQNNVGQYVTVYFNGEKVATSANGQAVAALPNDPPVWRRTGSPKYFYLNQGKYFYNWDFSSYGALKVQRVNWYNAALSPEDILDIYNEADFISNPVPDVNMAFRLQDVATNQFMTYNVASNTVSEDYNGAPIYLEIFSDPSVFGADRGAVALKDINTYMFLRQSGWGLRQSGFAGGNHDFGWVFYKTDKPNEYVIKNFFDDGVYLDFDGNAVRVEHAKQPRRWRVVGNTAAVDRIAKQPEPDPISFKLMDTQTNQYWYWDQGRNEINESFQYPVVEVEIQQSGDVYAADRGAVALKDKRTGLYIRHAGWTLRQSQFTPNNYDFGWVFYKTEKQDEYIIRNFFNDKTYIGYDGRVVRIQNPGGERTWKVVGNTDVVRKIAQDAPKDPFFQIMDVQSGQLMKYNPNVDEVTLNYSDQTIQFEIDNPPNLFGRDKGAVGLRDINTKRYFNHGAWIMHLGPFWHDGSRAFWFEKTNTPDVYYIKTYGDGVKFLYIGFNGKNLTIEWTDTPRRWKIVGNTDLVRQYAV